MLDLSMRLSRTNIAAIYAGWNTSYLDRRTGVSRSLFERIVKPTGRGVPPLCGTRCAQPQDLSDGH